MNNKDGKIAGNKKGKQQKKRRKRSFWRALLRILAILAGLIVLLYAVVLGLAWLQKKYPGKVDLGRLWNRVSSSATGYVKEKSLKDELQELSERNEEARGFVEDYENRELYLGQDIDLSKEVEEGVVPLFLQWDKRWGYESFGSSNIGLAGCGPTCLSMAYVYLTGDTQGNPRKMADFCERGGYYTDQGTSWDFWTYGAAEVGLTGRELPLDEAQMQDALAKGELIVCSMRPGDFTTAGHYILVVGYEEGGFRINDPNRRSNSEKLWKYETLKGQIRNLWGIGR